MFSYFIVKEQSMEPSCREGDFVLVSKMSYLFSRPKIGQLVVLKDPGDSSCLVLKRITAVKGSLLWVQGDNKEKSTDSRHFGWVSQSNIVGRVFKVSKSPLLKNECGDPHTFAKK